jgi:HNH endonuclease
MKTDLFGEYEVIEGYDPDDEPGPFGISFNRLKRLLEVNVDEGWVRYKIDRRAGKLGTGKIMAKAGDFMPYHATIDGSSIYLHMIIWVFAHNGNWCWPPDEIDHCNGDNSENKIQNLRLATRQQNIMNKGIHKNNKSGVPGVFREGNKWRVEIRVNYRGIYLGRFSNFNDAVAARHAAEDRYFGRFATRHHRPDYSVPLKGPDLFA